MIKIILSLVLIIIVSSLAFGNQIQPAYATQSNPDLFASAENSQFQNYFAGPQVIEVKVTDPGITSINQVVAEPSVTVNGKKLRMVQATDGNWYAFFADSKRAQIADSTQPVGSGKGLDFGMFCSSASAIAATGVDFSDTNGITIVSSAPGATDGSSSPTATLSSTCSGPVDGSIKSISGSSILNHVVRKAPSLNQMSGVSGGKIGQIGINQNAWPAIQLYDFSSLPTAVAIQYNKGGTYETVNLTFDRIQMMSGVNLYDVYKGFLVNAPIKISITDPQLNIDPTDKNSWTFATNPAFSTNPEFPALYYMAFDSNGKPDADGTAGMKDISISLTSLMFNHNGKLTIVPGNGIIPTFQSNGIQTLNSQGGTLSLPPTADPVTIIQSPNDPTKFFNYDSTGKPGMISTQTQRGQSFTMSYNNYGTTVISTDFEALATLTGILPDRIFVDENTKLTTNLLSKMYNYTTTTIVTNPGHGTILIGQNNTASYTPNSFYTGDDQFSVKITSGTISSQVYPVNVLIYPVDYHCLDSTKPNSTISTIENYPAQIDLGCKASFPIVYSVVKTTSNGVFTIDSTTGKGTYTPNQFFSGSDKFSYKFNPGLGFSQPINVTINVPAADYTPTAKVGSDQSIHEKQIVTLDGSASTDPYYNEVVRLWNTSQGNSPPISNYLKYSWTQTAGIPVTLSSKTVTTPTFTAPSSSSGIILTFTLTVSDKGTSTSHPVSITVFPSTVQINQTTTTNTSNPAPSGPSTNSISVTTDKSSYNQGDSITISGKLGSAVPSHAVTLEVLNTFQNPAYIASLTPASDGSITTKLLAKGPLWESSGTYTIKIQYNSTVSSQTTFYYNPSNATSTNNVTSTQTTIVPTPQTSQLTTTQQSTPLVAPAVIINASPYDIANIVRAKYNQTIAAEINVVNQTIQTQSIDNNISVKTNNTSSDSLSLTVTASSQTAPKVFLINLGTTSINVANLKELGIMYDGKPIQPAIDVYSLLHAKSTDDPRYAIIVTQSGVQILVLVPHFSTHTITITNMSKVILVVPEFPFALLTLIIAVFSIVLIPKIKQSIY